VIEVNLRGEVTYTNPAADKLFPDISPAGWSHPLLSKFSEINELRLSMQQNDVVREVEVGESVYELHAHYIQGLDLIRIYVLDITQRKLAEREIHLLATTDSLTGIANRREFTAILLKEMGRARRYDTTMSLVMYDIDYFKHVNDNFGHDVGDDVLQAITGIAKDNIRVNDVAARWGGEEFMVLMPQSDLQAAFNAAEKLRAAIVGHDFDKVGRLTVSFGVAELAPQDDLNLLLKRVDDALYRAKEMGRNRVEALTWEAVSR
jgi:two-component system cell cycle response regulator